MKLVIEEPESSALAGYLAADPPVLATSRIALVEVLRATTIANPSTEVREEATRLLESCLLVEVSDALLRSAASLASAEVRTLDAIHLASARRIEPDGVLVYHRRLLERFRRLGFAVVHPGA